VSFRGWKRDDLDVKLSRSESIGRPIKGGKGMVSAMHPKAAQVAATVLSEGGSAHDAALAALAMLCVVEPFMSGPGGHGAAVVAEPGRPPYVIDGSARGPGLEAWRDPPLRGAGAVAVPAALSAWLGLHEAGSRCSLDELLSSAVAEARAGTPAAWYTALMIASNARLLSADAPAKRIFLAPDGLPPRASTSGSDAADSVSNPDLAETLERIAKGGLDELRHGETGRRIVEAVRGGGGALGESDLDLLRVAEPQPALTGSFRGWEVHSGPTSSAAPCLLEMLNLLEDLDPAAVRLGSAEYFAAIADAQRAAFLDRDQYGDPHFVPAPVHAYADPELARLRAGDLRRSGAEPLPRRDLSRPGYPVDRAGTTLRPGASMDETSTTHVNIAAPDGTLIAATFTLGFPFGAGIVAAGTGLLLGNTLHQFHSDPHHPNGFEPGKRAVWNGAPTVLCRDGRPRIAVGAPGGPRIPGAIAQVLVAHLIYGLSPQRAVEVPRVFQAGDVAYLDDRVRPEVVSRLKRSGRRIETVAEGPFASAFGRPGIVVMDEDGSLHGGVDPWRLGSIAAW
jgi:gamma-glutamyltranspeptidase/glutathione hydrolase